MAGCAPTAEAGCGGERLRRLPAMVSQDCRREFCAGDLPVDVAARHLVGVLAGNEAFEPQTAPCVIVSGLSLGTLLWGDARLRRRGGACTSLETIRSVL